MKTKIESQTGFNLCVSLRERERQRQTYRQRQRQNGCRHHTIMFKTMEAC